MIYSFAGFDVDTDQIEIRHDGAPIHVEPQVFAVLVHLLERRARVVTKIELLDDIWGGAFVSESALTSRIKSVRHTLGDSGQAQRIIRTVHGRGYQFVADVIEHRTAADALHPSGSAAPPSGTVSFLVADIADFDDLWLRHRDVVPDDLDRFRTIVETVAADHEATPLSTAGRSGAAAFALASTAVAAAADLRSALNTEAWRSPIGGAIRIGVHTGEALERDGTYLGPAFERTALVAASAHGGQTLVSDLTRSLVSDQEDWVDLGMCRVEATLPAMRLWQLGDKAFPALRNAVAAAPPALRTELIGRDQVLEVLTERVVEHRLVSIVGPGGVGKTTLGLAVANAVLASFPAGVSFVELHAAHDASEIVRAVAGAAGVEGPAAADARSLAEHLAARATLVVLDNCEHVLDECAEFVDLILDSGGAASVLTTTREPLGVDGEAVVPLGSLEDDAPALFVMRALEARPGIELDPDDPRIQTICADLDGLPLAIELAAAQLVHLDLDALADRLSERLDLSRGARSRGRERHATLERTIAWSHDLLDPDGRWLFRQFGAFPAGFDLAAAEAVGSRDGRRMSLHVLSDLVAKNLLTHDRATGRYRLLETIRAFASRQLRDSNEEADAAERLRRHIVDQVTGGSRSDRWFSGAAGAALRRDLDNVRFAFDRSVEIGRVSDALEILIAACYLVRTTMNGTDGRRWLLDLEAAATGFDALDQLWYCIVRADLAQGAADHDVGRTISVEAVELAANADQIVATVIAHHYAALHQVVPAPQQARQTLQQTRELAASAGEPRLVQLLDAFDAVTAMSAGEIDKGTELAEKIGHEVSGDGYEVFIANWAAWTAALLREDSERLRYWIDRQRRYLVGMGYTEPWLFLWSAALVAAIEGDDPLEDLRSARARADAEGHDIDTDIVLALALIARWEGRSDDAAELLGTTRDRTLNNLSHYIVARSLREALASDGVDIGTAMQVGAARSPRDVVEAMGLVPT